MQKESQMSTPLRVLLVEDSEGDARLIVLELEQSGYDVSFERVYTADTFSAALSSQDWDVIIADYYMPEFSGLEALTAANESGLDLPFIVASGVIGEDVAVEAMRSGAYDYVMKGHLVRLGPAVERALREAEVRQARKQVEEALWESQRELAAIFDNAPVAMILVDQEWRVRKANRTAAALGNRPADEMIGLRGGEALRCLHHLDDPRGCGFGPSCGGCVVRHAVVDTFETGKNYYHEEATLSLIRDGAQVEVHVLVSTTLIDALESHLVLVSIEDVTAHKQADAIIHLRLELFEFAVDHSLEALMQKALDEIGEITNSPISFYHFVEADQKTLSLQAWSTRTLQEFCQAEGKGLHYDIDQAGVWVDCVHQRKPVIHNDYAALPHRKGMPEGHAEVKRELVVPTMRDGRIVSILGVGNKPSSYDEKDVELVAYVADVIWSIVERKRDEEQLRGYQRQLEAQNLELRKLSLAIEQSGSIIVITDTDGNIQYVNPRFEETTGYTSSEALGQNPRILKSGEQDAEYYAVLWDTISSGQIWRGEFHNRRKDGMLYWESATIAPIHNSAGQITSYIAIKEDITERRQAEEALRRYAAELEARNEELDAFAHTAAHDLKNPLGLVIGYADILAMDYLDLPPEDAEEYIREVARNGRRMGRIIDEMLLLAGVRQVKVEIEPVDIEGVARESLQRLVDMIEEYQAEVILPGSWPEALGYAPWIEEVWVNYVNNAIKYGGRPPRVELGAQELPDGRVRFWVRDNGPGLSPKEQGRLFRPFTRLDQAHTKGHGLGLSIVRRIVEKLGGQVGVESEEGKGSTFSFTLPSVPEA
jgi:PAS domain S-box-containing protein